MKFSEMPYARPDLDAVKQQFADLLARFKAGTGKDLDNDRILLAD